MTERNRRSWDRESDAYQAAHRRRLSETALAWGVWRIREEELRVLGDVNGREVLELGCGAAQWSVALARSGARVTGVDLSERQLSHAAVACGGSGNPTLIHAAAEALPFADESFDIVFCDHGATVFAPPEPTMSEAARVLRPEGLLAFCMSSPIRDICRDPVSDRIVRYLHQDYFGLYAIDDDDHTCYQLPYGGWIRLFRTNGLEVEDLIELAPPAGAATTYTDYVPIEWAGRWPAENIWKVRKRVERAGDRIPDGAML